MQPSITSNKGFTLIEVMIAVFVLAIGILGVAGLQLFANQNTYEANQRTTAAALASSIIERIRVNADVADNYLGSTTPVTEASGAPACTAAVDCTPQQLADHDLQIWHNMIVGVTEESQAGDNTGGLVAPSACITQPAGYDDNQYRIAIAWRGRSPLTSPSAEACGNGAVDGSGNNIYGASNEYRRVFFIDMTLE